jgi:LacI family transcriptional regulator
MFSEHTTPSLSTMDQQTVIMGQEAFNLLNQIMENGNAPTSDKIVVKPLPVIRESSSKSRK